MFWNKQDKIDAEKWRDAEKKRIDDVAATRASCKVTVHLNDGTNFDYMLFANGKIRNHGFMEYFPVAYSANDVMEGVIARFEERVVKEGIKYGDTLYTPSFIIKVEFGLVEGAT